MVLHHIILKSFHFTILFSRTFLAEFTPSRNSCSTVETNCTKMIMCIDKVRATCFHEIGIKNIKNQVKLSDSGHMMTTWMNDSDYATWLRYTVLPEIRILISRAVPAKESPKRIATSQWVHDEEDRSLTPFIYPCCSIHSNRLKEHPIRHLR